METKQITINIPDFIDYEELKKELFINLKLEIKSEVKNMLKRDFFNSDEFKRVVVEEVAKYMSEIIKTTNAPDIIKCKIKEYVNSLDSDSYVENHCEKNIFFNPYMNCVKNVINLLRYINLNYDKDYTITYNYPKPCDDILYIEWFFMHKVFISKEKI
jgi:hypothetical protein